MLVILTQHVHQAIDQWKQLMMTIWQCIFNVQFSASALQLIRPLDIVCRRTYSLPGFLTYFLSFFLSFFRQLLSEVAERNSTISGHMVGSKCNLKMHVRNLGYPIPLQIGGPKTTFLGRLRNSTATLTVYILGIKHDMHKWASALQTTRGLIHRLKTTWTLV